MHERELRRQAIAAVHQPNLFMLNDPRYNPSEAIEQGKGFPEHPVLEFWSRGPGLRHHEQHDIILTWRPFRIQYFVFEPDWLQVADGIMHTHELRVALGGTARRRQEGSFDQLVDGPSEVIAEAVDSRMANLVAAWESEYAASVRLRIKNQEINEPCGTEKCGTGQAARIDGTRAMQYSSRSTVGMCFPYNEDTAPIPHELYSGGTPRLPLLPISQWPSHQVSHFLFAWQRLKRLYDMMSRDHASVYLGLEDLDNKEVHSWRSLTVPLPFILPWRTMSEMSPEERALDDDLSVKIVPQRGCRWITMDRRVSNSTNAALTDIALEVAQQLHLYRNLVSIQNPMVNPMTYFEGKRPLHGEVESKDSVRPMDSFIHNASDATLTAASDLLQSSFLFHLGNGRVFPFPSVLIAPIAPGWIGGLIAGGSSV